MNRIGKSNAFFIILKMIFAWLVAKYWEPSSSSANTIHLMISETEFIRDTSWKMYIDEVFMIFWIISHYHVFFSSVLAGWLCIPTIRFIQLEVGQITTLVPDLCTNNTNFSSNPFVLPNVSPNGGNRLGNSGRVRLDRATIIATLMGYYYRGNAAPGY